MRQAKQSRSCEERWANEQEFFDGEEYSEQPIPADTIARYTECRRPFLPAEYPFWVLGDVRGKRIFELGCGDGGNAVLLALKGAATVIGIDISPRAIEIARNRARMHDVAGRTEFYALPIEACLENPWGKFDIVCGFAILHHLIPVLDSVMAHLKALSHEQTRFMFAEPVSLSPALRRLRLAVPLKAHGTPDERPLAPSELEVLCRHVPNLQLQLFGSLLRVWARLVPSRYEDYSPLRRSAYHLLARVDGVLVSLPLLRLLASTAVIHT